MPYGGGPINGHPDAIQATSIHRGPGRMKSLQV